MRVKSPLADIDFVIGGMHREGDRLVFTSAAESSLEARVEMTPKDAGKMIKAFLMSPSAIGLALSLPFLWLKGDGKEARGDGATGAHPFDRLNKPW